MQTWSNTFCPNVLSSASEASATSTSSTSSSPSTDTSSTTSYTSSSASSIPPAAVASPTSTSPSSSSASSTSVGDFGAGTHGTTWGKLPVNPSKANRGPAFEAVSIILLSVAALVLAFRCVHQERVRQETTRLNLVRFFARMYTKSTRQVVRGVGPDEWFALVTLVRT